jgi:hypothetical protein
MLQEREDASALFKSKKGKELQKEIAKKAKTFVPGAGLPDTAKPSGNLPLSACCRLFYILKDQTPRKSCLYVPMDFD